MQLTFHWQRLEALSVLEFYHLIAAREAVFVVEQNCPYQETDAMDLQAWHLRVMHKNELIACARVVDPGVKYPQPSIGRVMTVKSYRQHKIGRALMQEAIRFTEQTFPAMGIKIGAQVYLRAFYESLGFTGVGEAYDEDGIMHMDMIKPG